MSIDYLKKRAFRFIKLSNKNKDKKSWSKTIGFWFRRREKKMKDITEREKKKPHYRLSCHFDHSSYYFPKLGSFAAISNLFRFFTTILPLSVLSLFALHSFFILFLSLSYLSRSFLLAVLLFYLFFSALPTTFLLL